MSEDRDVPADAGRAPPFDRAPRDAADPSGEGYSGQEYDNDHQQRWRERQRTNDVAPGGEAVGSGVSAGGGNDAEEYDDDTATGGGTRPS